MPEKRNSVQLLVIDDLRENLDLIVQALTRDGIEILTAGDAETGFQLFVERRPAIVLLDLILPRVSGMELLEKMVANDPGADIILMTGHYSTDSAVQAIQKGACDYLTKPLELARLRSVITRLLTEAERRRKVFQLDRDLMDACQLEGIIGRSPAILDTFAKIRRVAPHFQTVLVTGETGTGKELVAKALHRLSPASAGPFAVCNCSALVETLLESELFGHVRGAFTGAVQDKVGLFESAQGGVVFLDEIGELPLSSQAKLLRVLQQREIQRVGSPKTHKVNARVIGATNRDLRALVAEGRFREDLYYRLAMVEIHLPRLADRKEDLPMLQKYFVEKFAAQYAKPIKGITRRAQVRLASHAWPGNVRELENVIGSAAMMAQGITIDLDDLGEFQRGASLDESLATMQEIQNRHLFRVLEHVDGNKARAAEILGLSRATVYEMLARIKQAGVKAKRAAGAG